MGRIQILVGQAEMSEAESEVRRGSDAAVRPRPNYLTTTPLAASPALPPEPQSHPTRAFPEWINLTTRPHTGSPDSS